MERLTERGPRGFAYYPACMGCREGLLGECIGCDEEEKQCETLAAYEDTGLTPEEIEALKKSAGAPFGMSAPAPSVAQCKQIAVTWTKYIRALGAALDISPADVVAMMLLAAMSADGKLDDARNLLTAKLTDDSDDIPEGATFE